MVLAKGVRGLHVWCVAAAVRLASVLVVRTWYVPDEYWQTLEVAHERAFGYGALTWEWRRGLRSHLYPGVVAALYTLLKYTHLDYPQLIIYGPRILQALLSATADYCFYKWSSNRKWALFLMLTSWFWFYTASRTLLQTLETALVTIALSVFPFNGGKQGYYDQESVWWILLCVVCVFVRPSSAPLWAVLVAYHLLTTHRPLLRLLVRTYVPIIVLTGGALVALDSYCHGSLIVTPWEFFRFNILHDISSFYGTHPWYWYICVGVPAVLGVSVVPVAAGAAAALRRPREHHTSIVLLAAILLHIALHSMIPHKEFRFILPLVPPMLYLAQDAIVPWSRKALKWQLYAAAAALLVCNAAPALYFSTIHQAAPLRAMDELRARTHHNTTLAFLMPCHSTPLYSHLHMNVTARYLSCDPSSVEEGRATEAETFFNNPLRWWRHEYSTKQQPSLLVMFDTLRGRLDDILRHYTLLHQLPHTQFPEGEVGENILIYERVPRPPAPPATVDQLH